MGILDKIIQNKVFFLTLKNKEFELNTYVLEINTSTENNCIYLYVLHEKKMIVETNNEPK